MLVKIGELAKMTDCQVVTIRYYEKEGLLAAPERTESNYRLYDNKDIERLRFIRHCRRHDMKLSEIRELLAFKDDPNKNCDWINTLVERHIASVCDQIESLTHLKQHLEQLLTKCSGQLNHECGIIASLSTESPCPFCEDFRCRLEHGVSNK